MLKHKVLNLMTDKENSISKNVNSKYIFDTTPERSKLMGKIRNKNTKPEITLRKAMWHKGIRYRLNVKALPGKPDIVISSKKIAIFVDGEFWHGYDWLNKRDKIKANRDYWIPKIERNIQRDKKNNIDLQNLGYTVMRFWEQEIKNGLEACILKISSVILLRS